MHNQKPLFIWVNDQFGSPSKTNQNPNNEILQQYFELEIWDIRGLNKAWYKKNPDFRFNPDVEFTVRYLFTLSEIENQIKKIKHQKVAFLISGKIGFWNRGFIRCIEKNNIPYFFRRNRSGFYEANFGKFNGWNAITSKRKKMINLIGRLAANNVLFKFRIKGPSGLFIGTNLDLTHVNFPYSNSKIVYTHTKDYDNYLMTKNNSSVPKDCIVYIDQYFPFHAETKQFKINPEKHYNAILHFLQQLKELYKKRVVIAGHPACNKELFEKFVPKDLVLYGKTSELINHGFCCVTFNSNAILSAIITKTPVILITQNSTLPAYFNLSNDVLENIFSTASVDIESEITKEKMNTLLNSQKKSQQKNFGRLIKHPNTPDEPEFEIISKTVLEYFNNQL